MQSRQRGSINGTDSGRGCGIARDHCQQSKMVAHQHRWSSPGKVVGRGGRNRAVCSLQDESSCGRESEHLDPTVSLEGLHAITCSLQADEENRMCALALRMHNVWPCQGCRHVSPHCSARAASSKSACRVRHTRRQRHPAMPAVTCHHAGSERASAQTVEPNAFSGHPAALCWCSMPSRRKSVPGNAFANRSIRSRCCGDSPVRPRPRTP